MENDTILRYTSINDKAKEWEREGIDVKADIGGWERPPVFEGLRSTIRGKRGDVIRLGFVDFDQEANKEAIKKSYH